MNFYTKITAYFKTHKQFRLAIYIAASLFVAGLLCILLCNLLIARDKRFILPANSTMHQHIGIVLGAGITKQGKPFKELQARLDVAAKGVQSGQVDGLLLSGDNSLKTYDEPKAMMNYLVNTKHIPAAKLQVDDAGRDTYASCERASKIFGLQRTIIYSAPSHLPRAIFLCRHFGIQAYGVSSGVDGNNATRREAEASVKAVLNTTLFPEQSILGSRISFEPKS
jgi:vancomycin permeability regulator SanA